MVKETLAEIAAVNWKDQPSMQEKWVDAVLWLRNYSTKGWVYDKEICKTTVAASRSEGYAV